MARRALSMLAERHPLATPLAQRERLAALATESAFEAVAGAVLPGRITTLQLNLGKRCNQTCAHCHVDAGPDRTEVMDDRVMDACLACIEGAASGNVDLTTVDITGGAPELHARFEELVTRAVRAGRHVIDRCNLTILTLPRYRHLPRFFADHRVEVVCSLPYYEADRTDAQRGDGVYGKSIRALQQLNAVGYGVDGRGLSLVVMTNPVGAFLPAGERALEADFRRALQKNHGVTFTRLSTLTNMPIARYLEWLERTGNTERYFEKLRSAYNPDARAGLMCRTSVSVAYDGNLYGCDFNQMLELRPHAQAPATIFEWDAARFAAQPVTTAAHCFGCTAGQGSSCGGALVATP